MSINILDVCHESDVILHRTARSLALLMLRSENPCYKDALKAVKSIMRSDSAVLQQLGEEDESNSTPNCGL
jgi:hypothetical protein